MADEEDIARMQSSKARRERMWLARAAFEALQLWGTTTECPTGIISDAVGRGNLGGVYGLLRALGAFVDPGVHCGDTVSQVASAGDSAAVASSENISGASIVSTLDVDYKTLCLAAYRHSRIKMALLDVSNTISMSILSQYFCSLWSETPGIEATTAGNSSANGNLYSTSQETKSETRNELVDVWVPGEACPMADQSKVRITMSAMVPFQHADVRGVYGMADVSAFTFTGAKSSAVVCAPPLEIIARHVRTRRAPVPKRMLMATSRNRARTPRRLKCSTSSVTIAERPLQQVNDSAVPILGARSPLAALPLHNFDERSVPVFGAYNPIAALPLQQANQPAASVIGAYSPLVARAMTADIGNAENMGTMPLVSARVTKKYHVVQAILRRTPLLPGQAWTINRSAGLPFVPASRQHNVACLARCDGAPLKIANLQVVLSAAAPRDDAVSLLRGSVARARAKLARTYFEHILKDRVTKSFVLDEIRAVHKLVNDIHLDDGAAIRKRFAGGAPIAVARVGCLRLLHKAAENNSRRAIAALLEVGCNANVLDSAGVSPLHVATEHGFGDVVHMLLDANADCQAVDAKGDSALVKAAGGGYDNVVKMLLEAGANPNADDESGDTPLHLAARHGDYRTIKCLAEFGAVDMNAVNDKQESALYMAVKIGDTDSITVLLDEGASVTDGFGFHGSAVYLAAHLGLQNCLEVIIDGGGSIDIEGKDMPSPLFHAVQSQDADAVLMLLSHGASVWNKYSNGDTLLHIASDAKSVESLTKFGARANGRNRWNCTPLHCAVIDGKKDVLEALLKADVRVDIDAKTDEAMTALHYAVRRGDTGTIKTLLRSGADTRARNKRRGTALHMAVELDLLEAVRTLLGDGALATSAVDKSEPTPPKKGSGGKSNAKILPSNSKRPALALRRSKLTGEGGGEALCPTEHEERFAVAKVSARFGNCVNNSNDIGQSPLHIAASIGNTEVARALLACGARPGATDKRGATPLHNAVLYAHHDIVLALLAGGANVGRANEEGKTALHIACDFGGLLSLATIDALLAHGASAACEESNGYTPLHVAILSSDQVVPAEAKPHKQSPSVSEIGGREECTPSHASVNKSSEEVVGFLLNHGAPVDAKNNQGKSPLRLACEKGRVGIARVLLRAGASTGVGGEKGICPLHIACSRGDVEMVKLLLGAGAIPGHCFNLRGVSPLHVAAEWGHLGAVKALLPRLNKRQVNLTFEGGTTALVIAVKRRDKDIVAALVKAGADLTARTPEGLQPLSVIAGIASTPDSADIVRSMLKGGAKPDAFSMGGFMPLHTACTAGGDAGVVEALLEGGADGNFPCPGEGFLLPLHLAAKNGHAEAARLLATTPGCKLDEKANNGATALTMAVSNGHTETVRALLESGAVLEKNVLDENGVDIGSHVQMAILNGHVDTCRLLLQAVAIEHQAKKRAALAQNVRAGGPTDQPRTTTSGGVSRKIIGVGS